MNNLRPAIPKKRQLGDNMPVNVRRVQVKNLITKSGLGGRYAINPYVGCPHKCVYCYAACINYSGVERAEEWGTFLDVKIPSEHLNLAKIFRRGIFFSSMTDAYNPYEARALVTRKILQALLPAEPQISILTKSKLVTRDIDLFKQFKRVKIAFSFSSIDDGFRRRAEPYASSPRDKIAALKLLKNEGIATSVFIAPIFPEISDPVAISEAVAPYVKSIWYDSLNLRAQNRDKVLAFAALLRPDLIPLYEDIYLRKNKLYWIKLSKEIKNYCTQRGIRHSVFFQPRRRSG